MKVESVEEDAKAGYAGRLNGQGEKA